MLCTVYAMALCLCLSVCLSQDSVLLKWLNTGVHKQCHTIAQGLYSVCLNILPPRFSGNFSTTAENFQTKFYTHYAIMQNFIQLSLTLTKLCPIKRDHAVNVCNSLPASDGEFQNQPICI